MIDEKIQEYAEKYTSGESEVLRKLREKTFGERADKSMLSGFYQGRLLAMLSKMLAPRRILEIGTYMGYSALCLAEGLAEGGKSSGRRRRLTTGSNRAWATLWK
jgi:predicted O-methyltransferase YrrM